jgi:hypothetical protein
MPVTWPFAPPEPAPPTSLDAGGDLAPDSPIDVGVPFYHQSADFLALADNVLPNWYLDPMKAQSVTDTSGAVTNAAGYELIQAFAAMFSVASLAVGNMQVLSTLAYSSGGQYALASVQFYRTSLGSGTFTVKAGTIVKTSKTNRGYQVTQDFTFGPSAYFVNVLVQSLGQDQDYNVAGPVVLADGTVLPGEIDTVYLPIMSPAFAEPGLQVQQVATAYGGCAPVLDQLGVDRGILRAANELDTSYKKRARALPDTVAPGAVQRHLDSIFYQFGLHYDLVETWQGKYNSCYDAPSPAGGSGTVFGNIVNLAFDDTSTTRFVPRWMDENDHRGAFVLVTPTFPTAHDRGECYDDPATGPDPTRGISAWDSPAFDAQGLSGAYDGFDNVGQASRGTFLTSVWNLLQSIKGGGVNVAFIPAEANETLPGAPYP